MQKIEQLRERLRIAGAKPSHEQALLRSWTQALPLDSGRKRPENFLPFQLRDALPANKIQTPLNEMPNRSSCQERHMINRNRGHDERTQDERARDEQIRDERTQGGRIQT